MPSRSWPTGPARNSHRGQARGIILDPRGHNLLPAEQIIELIDSRAPLRLRPARNCVSGGSTPSRSLTAVRKDSPIIRTRRSTSKNGYIGNTASICRWSRFDPGRLQKTSRFTGGLQKKFLVGGELDKTVNELIAVTPMSSPCARHSTNVSGTKLTSRDFEIEVQTDAKDMVSSPDWRRGGNTVDARRERARQVLREELTDLEQLF